MSDQSDPVVDELENMADAAVALVGVTDEGLRGLADVFRGVERIKGRDGDPGPKGDPGPPGQGIKGDRGIDGRDGTDAPRPVRVVAERNYQRRLTGAQQVLSDGSSRHFTARRDVHGLIAEFVLSPGQEPQP